MVSILVMAIGIFAKRYFLYVSLVSIGLLLLSYSSSMFHLEREETKLPQQENGSVDVVLVMADIKNYLKFRSSFRPMISSLVKRSSHDINLHVIGDNDGRSYVHGVLANMTKDIKVHLIGYDMESILTQLKDDLKDLRPYFQGGENGASYYARDLFLITPLMHRVFNSTLGRIIVLDTDLYFKEDIWLLNKQFDSFTEKQVGGCAPELSPVYHHILYKYRQSHPNSIEGAPLPEGHPGFNIGVLLLHLEHMRTSSVYQDLLKYETLTKLAEKFSFKGHLGGQDFFNLASFAEPDLFYRLSCGWNKQLCTWWRDHGYANVFDKFATCTDKVKVYHGNCDTSIPKRVIDAD